MAIQKLSTALRVGPAPAPAANFSNTATGTYTTSNVKYKYITYTSSSTITFTIAGYADILVVGGGGGGHYDGNTAGATGGGGGVRENFLYVTPGTYTVTIGAGGGVATVGGTSDLVNILKAGGGGGALSAINQSCDAFYDRPGVGGGVGQGAFFLTYTQTGYGSSGSGAGGTIYGSTAQSGVTSSLNNTSTEYGKAVTYNGGGGAGGANTGTGGGRGTAGGSGIIIVRVRTN